jgi:phosphoglycolate phosphatase-like HAD superfamily hydrolase
MPCEQNVPDSVSAQGVDLAWRQAKSRIDAAPPTRTAEPLAGLIFEMADVLYDATLWRRWLWRLLSQLTIRADYHEFFAAWDREFLVEVQQGQRGLREAFQAFLAGHGLTRGQIDEIEASCRQRRETVTLDTRPLPGVAATLLSLADEGLQLAVLADAVHTATSLQEQLVALGLSGCFAVVISSFDLGATTAAPIGFETALDRLGLRANEVAYVGRRARGLTVASSIGLRTIAFNQEDRTPTTAVISRFVELVDVARCWRNGAGAAIAGPHFLDAA